MALATRSGIFLRVMVLNEQEEYLPAIQCGDGQQVGDAYGDADNGKQKGA